MARQPARAKAGKKAVPKSYKAALTKLNIDAWRQLKRLSADLDRPVSPDCFLCEFQDSLSSTAKYRCSFSLVAAPFAHGAYSCGRQMTVFISSFRLQLLVLVHTRFRVSTDTLLRGVRVAERP